MSKFHFKKKYGQNFLRDEITLEKIASSIVPTNKDLIIEIGPGSGALTKKIKRYGAKIIAFEIDEETKRYLLPIEDEDTKIIYDNFLEVDIVKTIKHISYEKLYIIGNLPYYITTPILEHIIESQVDPHEIVIMVQKEVGERFLASPKTKAYGYMTVLLSYNYTVEKILDVKSTAFYPIPKVDSMVLKLKRKNRENIDYLKFQKLLKASFQFKRKTIKNNLQNYNLVKIEKILIKHGYKLDSRAEEVDLDTFIEISKSI